MNICVLGGGGFVGSALIPALLSAGHYVRVLDKFWFGKHMPKAADCITVDMRRLHAGFFEECDTLIHLACISNDPSFELSPLISASINGAQTFERVLGAAKEACVRRVIFASSSSVYGVRPQGEAVHEETVCNPLTDYSRHKLECELVLEQSQFDWTILRPATVCGWSPRLRLDVVVNAMTASALRNGRIAVHGGSQMRANLHIDDMVAAYLAVLATPKAHECIFNVGNENLTLRQIAEVIAQQTNASIVVEQSADERSYSIDSSWIAKQIGFRPHKTISNAVADIRANLWSGQHTINLTRLKELIDVSLV